MTEDKTDPGPIKGLPVFFFHAGGLPVSAITDLFESTGRLGRPDDLFDLDGSMWTRLQDQAPASFSDYLTRQIDAARKNGRRFSALIDWRDFLWLQHRTAFKELLERPFRAARLTCLDPALQARRRLLANSQDIAEPTFRTLSRELIAIEEDEAMGDDVARRYGLDMPRLWVEDLSRPGLPALRGLLDRWSISLPETLNLQPIDPPTSEELDAVFAFRSEARNQHWAHALTPRPASSAG